MKAASALEPRVAGPLAVLAVALAVGPLGAFGAVPAAPLPTRCPPASVLKAALRVHVTRVSSYAGPISSTTLAGMGPAPDSAHYRKTAQRERTCTYSGAPTGPITISFVAPVTSDAFLRARASLRQSGVPVATIPGIGDTAWAARAGGLLFVLRGGVDIVISAPRRSLEDLRLLAHQIV
jgi:hypothetical protein